MATAKKVPAKKTAPAAPAAKAAPAPKAEKAAKVEKEKIVRLVQNDTTRPKDGSKTGRVWEIADDITKTSKMAATRDAVIKIAEAEGIPLATVATQFQRWRVFNNVPRAPKADPKPKAPKAPPAPAAAKKAPAKKAA